MLSQCLSLAGRSVLFIQIQESTQSTQLSLLLLHIMICLNRIIYNRCNWFKVATFTLAAHLFIYVLINLFI